MRESGRGKTIGEGKIKIITRRVGRKTEGR